MSSVSFSGLATGLDSAAIIDSLVNVERIPIQRMEAQSSQYRSKIGVINSLSSALASFRTAAQELDTAGEVLSFSGKASDESVAKVTASGGSIQGSYQLEVTSLAQAQRTYSNTFADKTAALSTTDQTLDFTVNGQTTSVNIAAGENLEDVVGKINGSGAPLSAGIFYDGTNYRLQVVGSDTGAQNAISFADSGLGLGLDTPANTVQAATDAVFELDGFSVTSSTNLVSDVLPGTSIELKKVTTSPIQIDITPDATSVKDKVQKFVNAYNSVFSIINAQVGEGKSQHTLNGDSTVRTIEQGLSRMIGGAIPGLTTANGNTMQLGDLGISTNRDGTLTLDSTKFDEALAGGFTEVARYFAGDEASGIDGMGAMVDDLIDTYTDSVDGVLTTRKKGLDRLISDNEKNIESKETYIERYAESLKAQFAALESSMSSLQSQQAYLASFMQR